MSEFVKYQHLERYGTDETENITDGVVYVFPKIDGTNGSIWLNETIRAGSRNRELSLDNDNAGFMGEVIIDERYHRFFAQYPDYRLYGEWLVPHSLKTYQKDAWRKFYVFDVYKDGEDEAVHYEEYSSILDEFGINYIPPIAIIKNPTDEQILRCIEKCGMFLIENGAGLGEGIVLKNYHYRNKYERQTWAKIITNEFKTLHHLEMGAPLVNGSKMVEEDIVESYVTAPFIEKEKAKIEATLGPWRNEHIPRLLGVVFHELVTEEIWNICKKYKNPKINFSLLNRMTIDKVKRTIGV